MVEAVVQSNFERMSARETLSSCGMKKNEGGALGSRVLLDSHESHGQTRGPMRHISWGSGEVQLKGGNPLVASEICIISVRM